MTQQTSSEPDRLAITTEKIALASLEPGDLLHVTFPAPHVQVLDNERRAGIFKVQLRNKIALRDDNDVSKTFYISPERMVQRVTNPNIQVGPWHYTIWGGTTLDLTDDLATWQREDALWYRRLSPVAVLFVRFWQALLNLPCRVYPLKLSGGFVGILICIVVAAVALASRTDPQFSVAISILGAFISERFWEAWKVRIRHKIARGVSLRVRYRLATDTKARYGVLRLEEVGAIIIDGTEGQT